MNKLSLFLLSSSTLITSTWITVISQESALAINKSEKPLPKQSQSAPKLDLPCKSSQCTGNAHLANYLKNVKPLAEEFENLERTPEGHLILDISEEESNAAIEMFGCDCITSINALRQLKGIEVGVEGDRILPGPTIKPCNQPRAPQIP
jgi:hypothetical protein